MTLKHLIGKCRMMKLKLNKKKLKNLSLDSKVVPRNVTGKIVGGVIDATPTGDDHVTRTNIIK
jgi:hypothetical protein